jgi:cytoskeletal protein RodZ
LAGRPARFSSGFPTSGNMAGKWQFPAEMNRPNAPISLADLSAAGVRLRPYEAGTLVRELALQAARGDLAGVPSAHVIRLSAQGTIAVEGPVGAGGRSIVRAAQLLDSLLASADAGADFRVPGGLKLVVARALGTLDVPPFPSLEAFADALTRFAATDPAAMVTNLVVTWAESVGSRVPEAALQVADASSSANVEPFVAPRPIDSRGPSGATLTVSDIRRARRATGTPLTQIAERSRIPVSLLRQLEWGYLANWPAGQYGRTQLIRYARASGLDEQLVLSAIGPLLEATESRQALLVHKPPVPALIATVPAKETPIEPIVESEEIAIAPVHHDLPLRWPISGPVEAPPRLRTRILAALAMPALLAIGLLPAWWAYSTRTVSAPGAATGQNASRAVSNEPVAGSPVSPATSTGETRTAPDNHQRAPQETAAASRDERAVGAAPATEARPGSSAVKPTYRLAADQAAFSPSLASIGTAVFYRPDEDERAALTRGDAGSRGGAVLRITRIVDDSARNYHVRPSPDGTRIAFDSDRGGVRGVYVADADGRNVRRVSPDGYAAVPSWSPDGSMLAFVREEANRPEVGNLWTVDLASGSVTQITRHATGQAWGASWFPDGRRLAYAQEDRLIVRDLQSGEQRTFATPRKGRLLRTPAVSPDGRRIAFQVYRDGAWLLELPDGGMRRILEDPTAEEYVWSPDGHQLAYHSRKADAWGVWVMAPRGPAGTTRTPELP